MILTENMMPTAFETKALTSQSFMQRLLGQHPPENAIIELNNLLATRSILSIAPSDLNQIEQHYSASLIQYTLNLEEFYAVHFNYLFVNRCLTEDGLSELTHLRTLLQLPARSVEMLHERVGEVIYRQRVEAAVESGYISDDDKVVLAELRQVLSLPADLANSIYEEVCQICLDRFVQNYGSDARIAPEEESRLLAIGSSLGVKPKAATSRTIERFKRYWTIENADLPVVETSIALQKSEHCHYQINAVQWYEERATARRTNGDDHYEHHKSFDVIDLQSNLAPTRKETFNILKLISIGDLYLTNKRLIFKDDQKTTSVKLNTIKIVRAYKQGVLIGVVLPFRT